MITNAFTCTGPYAILIMLGIKRVENRSVMPVPSNGRCAVSCSKPFNAAEYGNFVQWASINLPTEDFERIPVWSDVKDWPGKVIGACDYSARKSDAVESWNEGYPYWWDLSGVVYFDQPIPCRDNVGMWQMPSGLVAQVTAIDRMARSVGEHIASAEDAAKLFRMVVPVAGASEGFFVLPLDESRRVLAVPVLVSLGEASTTIVEPREVFSAALQVGAKAIIVAHNHPSGAITPSVQDYELTDQLKWLGSKIGVVVLDHLIVSGKQWGVVEGNRKTASFNYGL